MGGWAYHPVALGLLAVAAGVGLGVALDAWRGRMR
jgi:hypothetical protein